MKLIRLIISIILGGCILVAALSNRQTVSIRMFPFHSIVDMPLFLLIFIVLLMGIFLGGIVNHCYTRRWKIRARKAEELSRAQNDEIAILKTSSRILGNH